MKRYTGCYGLKIIFLTLASCAACWAVSYPFDDGFEWGLANWHTNGSWGVTTEDARSPIHALTDSPGGLYRNSTDTAATMATGVDLSSATRPAARFYHRINWNPDGIFFMWSFRPTRGLIG